MLFDRKIRRDSRDLFLSGFKVFHAFSCLNQRRQCILLNVRLLVLYSIKLAEITLEIILPTPSLSDKNGMN